MQLLESSEMESAAEAEEYKFKLGLPRLIVLQTS